MSEALSGLNNLFYNNEWYFELIVDVGTSINHVINRFQRQVFSAEQQNDNKSFSLIQLNGHQTIWQLQLYGYQLTVTILEISKYLKIEIVESVIIKPCSVLVRVYRKVVEAGEKFGCRGDTTTVHGGDRHLQYDLSLIQAEDRDLHPSNGLTWWKCETGEPPTRVNTVYVLQYIELRFSVILFAGTVEFNLLFGWIEQN